MIWRDFICKECGITEHAKTNSARFAEKLCIGCYLKRSLARHKKNEFHNSDVMREVMGYSKGDRCEL